jgi:hypothetical protein
MKLLVFVHGYPPEQNAGAEWMIHEMVKSWIKFGHEVRVLSNYAGTFQGVRVEKLDISPGILMSNFQWADMVVSHLNMANLAYNKCRAMGKKFMFVVHNTHRYHYCNHDKVFVVQNAEWARATLNYSRPTIGSPTPGLRENLSYAGTFRLRDNISGWISAIQEFDDKSRYLSIRELGYQRVRELDPVPQLERLNDFIHAIESGHIT